MPEWAEHPRLPVHVLLTGPDTLKRNPAKSPVLLVQGTPDTLRLGFRAQVFSSRCDARCLSHPTAIQRMGGICHQPLSLVPVNV